LIRAACADTSTLIGQVVFQVSDIFRLDLVPKDVSLVCFGTESSDDDDLESSDDLESDDGEEGRDSFSGRSSVSNPALTDGSLVNALGRGVPEINEKQLKKLISLSSKGADDTKQQSLAIHHLQDQLKALLRQGGTGDSSHTDVRKSDIEALHLKLKALERRADNGAFNGSMSGRSPIIYTPLMVKDDAEFKKYFKLKAMDMPHNQIKMKMEKDGHDPSLLDKPNEVSPNDPGVRIMVQSVVFIILHR
jgi:hypothetical protein